MEGLQFLELSVVANYLSLGFVCPDESVSRETAGLFL